MMIQKVGFGPPEVPFMEILVYVEGRVRRPE
jgi:hypothetical protein